MSLVGHWCGVLVTVSHYHIISDQLVVPKNTTYLYPWVQRSAVVSCTRASLNMDSNQQTIVVEFSYLVVCISWYFMTAV